MFCTRRTSSTQCQDPVQRDTAEEGCAHLCPITNNAKKKQWLAFFLPSLARELLNEHEREMASPVPCSRTQAGHGQ
jgi:hypothetical protein